jgi:hypothetical protein
VFAGYTPSHIAITRGPTRVTDHRDLDQVAFRKSSYSGTENCVEVAIAAGADIVLRDSKSRSTTLIFTPDEWTAFLSGVKAGEFDIPD